MATKGTKQATAGAAAPKTAKPISAKSSTRKSAGDGRKLVIVESPTKAKTIGKYLGHGYTIEASGGHVVDLPASKMGIDLEHDFAPQYIVIQARRKTVAALKQSAKAAAVIYLAADPDREGEAICWHLANLLGDGKDVRRVEFHEITPRAIAQAFAHPVAIDMQRVNAQQARRILDRIVGYTLSPLLWRKVSRGLSAGRVQSVALRILVDREREIERFVPQEYWSLEATLQKRGAGEAGRFTAKLEQVDGEKIEIATGEQANQLAAELRGQSFAVADIKVAEKRRHPYAPYTTSTLQQDAYHTLRFPSERTMRIAQQLYEGVPVGDEGMTGLITYMRTDSVRIADDAMAAVRTLIRDRFGQEFLPEQPNRYKSKKSAQEAHEAIRPTAAERTPEMVQPYLTEEQAKLYDLIWRRFVASQMTPAVFKTTRVDITAGRCLLGANGSELVFAGFLAAMADPPQSGAGPIRQRASAEGSEEPEEPAAVLPPLAVGDPLTLVELVPSQHFTKPPPRYSDASLVKALEEDGIGRPSTYAPTIGTLVDRHYIERNAGALVPTELGKTVTDLLIQHFPQVLDVEFTARMEERLDQVEEGAAEWVEVVRDFYGPFSQWLQRAQEAMREVKKEVEATDKVCEQCGRPMVIKWGRRGRFLSCSGFPECRNAKPLTTGVRCPEPGCTGELVARRSKRGVFFGCSRYPQCTHISRKLPTANPPSADAPTTVVALPSICKGNFRRALNSLHPTVGT